MVVSISIEQLHRYLIACLFLFASISVPRATYAQEVLHTQNASWFRPLIFVGPTTGYLDLFEENIRRTGVSGRIGLRLPSIDVSLVGEHWSRWGSLNLSSVIAEANLYPFGTTGRVASYVLIGLGHLTYRDTAQKYPSEGGASGTLGVGVQTALWSRAAIRTEALLRSDDGGFNGQLRLGVGYAAASPKRSSGLPEASQDLMASWMTPIRGPWHFVEPAFGMRFTRPMSEQLSATIGLEVYHWQIPGAGLLRNYMWDTRAFVGTPGAEWRPRLTDRLMLRAGPALIVMGEGPDSGPNLGLHAAATTTIRPLRIPFSLGVGWLWLPRNGDEDPRVSPGEDQQGLLLFGGLRL